MGQEDLFDRNFISAVEKDGVLYWVTERAGYFMKMDLKTRTASFLEPKWMGMDAMYGGWAILMEEEGILYGIAGNGRFFFKYHILSGRAESYEIRLEKYLLHDYTAVCKQGDEICLLGYHMGCLLKIHCMTGEIKTEQLLEDMPMECEFAYAATNAVYNGIIRCFCHEQPVAVFYNMKDGSKEVIKLPMSLEHPLYVQETERGFYFLNTSGDVFLWDSKTGDANKMFKNPYGEKEYYFAFLCIQNKKLWLLPCNGEKILSYDLETKTYQEFEKYPSGFAYQDLKDMSKYGRPVEANGNIYFSMHTGNDIFCVDKKGYGYFLSAQWPGMEESVKQIREYMPSVVFEKDYPLQLFFNLVG